MDEGRPTARVVGAVLCTATPEGWYLFEHLTIVEASEFGDQTGETTCKFGGFYWHYVVLEPDTVMSTREGRTLCKNHSVWGAAQLREAPGSSRICGTCLDLSRKRPPAEP